MLEDSHRIIDPHAWQDPRNVRVYVQNIETALEQADPEGAAVYRANARQFDSQLQELDAWAEKEIAAIPSERRKVITSHDAFGYLGARYHVRLSAPQGASTETEPTAKGVVRLIRQIKREGVKVLFVENMTDPKLIRQIATETGAEIGPPLFSDALSPSSGPASNYIEMFRHNVREMVKAMKK